MMEGEYRGALLFGPVEKLVRPNRTRRYSVVIPDADNDDRDGERVSDRETLGVSTRWEGGGRRNGRNGTRSSAETGLPGDDRVGFPDNVRPLDQRVFVFGEETFFRSNTDRVVVAYSRRTVGERIECVLS